MTRAPTAVLEYLTDSDLSNWGVQKVRVYRPINTPKLITDKYHTRPLAIA